MATLAPPAEVASCAAPRSTPAPRLAQPTEIERRAEKLEAGTRRRIEEQAREVARRAGKRLETGEGAWGVMRQAWAEMVAFRRAAVEKLDKRIARMCATEERRLATVERRRQALVAKARSAGQVPERLDAHLDSANPAARAIALRPSRSRA